MSYNQELINEALERGEVSDVLYQELLKKQKVNPSQDNEFIIIKVCFVMANKKEFDKRSRRFIMKYVRGEQVDRVKQWIQNSKNEQVFKENSVTEVIENRESIKKIEKKPNLKIQKKYQSSNLPPSIEEKFEGLIGMEKVKEQISLFWNEVQFKKIREEKLGIVNEEQKGYHFMLLGNPGTGKTTVARILAEVLYLVGVRETNILIEVDRNDLVGEHIGQTEKITKAFIDKSLGGTMFVDEAYTLYKKGDAKDFGGQALGSFLTAMENHRGRFSLILAGYKKEMTSMLNFNTGLKSRINFTIEIDDYSDDELIAIAEQVARKQTYLISKDAKTAIVECINKERIDEKFGNARFIRELINIAIRNHAMRMSMKIMEGELHQNEMTILEACDFNISDVRSVEEQINDAQEELNNLIGLAKAKEIVQDIVNSKKIEKMRTDRNIELKQKPMSNHMVFVGNPGTGKTTVARIIGRIYKALGVLKRGDVFVECNRNSLVGSYQGHTAEKTMQVIQCALGGILFVDEAYALFQGENDTFGKEAIDTLISEMENKRENLVVILAGYKEDINSLLEVNSGFASRINIRVEFEDYSLDELVEIFCFVVESNGYVLEHGVLPSVANMFEKKIQDKNFGNARGVRNIFENLVKRQNARLAQKNLNKSEISDSEFITITKEDVENELLRIN